ncbi:COP9 signalosome complex subunit 7 [Lecanosticta acicola]|uniref:COP9 signalosome complex subunit 7 n=1 Tax=Lecanosticta acicola TaxID=111012 RepID=A0AAI9E9I8_9PEZI|nr:COP9 signalosome complex subunit 7 [Lecanosticta acicola]
MDQTRANNSLAPFIALAKSANSPRAAADLVTQATSAPNTYIFAELLQQPNIQALAENEQYGVYFKVLQHFAWGTLESYRANPLPELTDAQLLKLRLLSLLTIASQKSTTSSNTSNLSYQSLCAQLGLSSPIDLEHLVTEALYQNLITGTLNPAAQTVIITSVAPLRDLAPGSVQSMIAELQAWSGRCDSVLADLEAEIRKVKTEAGNRAKREARAEKQIKAVTDVGEKGGSGPGRVLGTNSSGHNVRGATKRDQADDDYEDDDAMDVDEAPRAPSGRKKSSGSSSGLLNRLTRGSSGRG